MSGGPDPPQSSTSSLTLFSTGTILTVGAAEALLAAARLTTQAAIHNRFLGISGPPERVMLRSTKRAQCPHSTQSTHSRRRLPRCAGVPIFSTMPDTQLNTDVALGV